MSELKQSTASQVVTFGIFVDSTDGDTEETGLTIANTDIKIHKWGTTTLANKNSGGATHISNGIYYATLDATDTNTLGPITIYIHVAGALYNVWKGVVTTANYWDSKYSTDTRQVDIVQIGGDTQSGTDLKDFADAGYDPATNKVQGVVLVDTTTTNTDMRGTDGANTVIPPTEAQMNARTLIAANYFDPAVDVVANVTLVDTTTTNTDMRGTDGANTVIPPTEAQMNARTLVAANYFDPAVDVVANVTLVDTTTTNTDMRGTDSALTDKAGFSLSAAGVDAIIDEVLTDLSDTDVDSGASITLRKAVRAIFNRFFREVTQTATTQVVKNDSDVAISDMTVSDDGTTQVKGAS